MLHTICCLFLCFVAGSRQLSITEFVVPQSVEMNSNAELRCRYNLSKGETDKALFVKWWWTPSAGEDRLQLYQRIVGHDPVTPQHKINTKIKPDDTIVLEEVQPNASGIYECEVSNIDEVRMHQELNVYTKGSGPVLNVTTVSDGPDEDDEEDILIKCEVENIAPHPYLNIFIKGESMNVTELLSGPDSDGFYDLYGNTTVSKSLVENAEISCEVFYVNSNITHPQFVAIATLVTSGTLTTTELPEDSTELDATIQTNPKDDGSELRSSLVLLVFISILTYLSDLLSQRIFLLM